jgi:hypothetical protein
MRSESEVDYGEEEIVMDIAGGMNKIDQIISNA